MLFPVIGMFALNEEEEEEGRGARSLFSEELDSVANVVRKMVEMYTNLNEDE